MPFAKLQNELTVLRLALMPVFIELVETAEGGDSWPAAIVFGLAAVTDQVDGWLARRLEVESEFGKYADPLADRLMIDAAVILLVIYERLPCAALELVIVRDAHMVAGDRLLVPHGF